MLLNLCICNYLLIINIISPMFCFIGFLKTLSKIVSMPGNLILLRFGELWLKSEGVKKRFLEILKQNIRDMLDGNGVKYTLVAGRTRFFVETDEPDKAIPALKRVFGITSLSPVVKTDITGIEKEALDLASAFGEKKTFAVRARREGKHQFTSQELERNLGAAVVDKFGLKVNLTKPDRTLSVEVRDNDAYVYSEIIRGAGGLPLGVEGRVLGILAKDKKSAAAIWLIMRRGARAVLVLQEKGAEKHIEILRKFDPKIKTADGENIKELAREYGAKAVVVAEEMDTVGKIIDAKKIKPLPVFRPIAGMGGPDIKKVLARMM